MRSPIVWLLLGACSPAVEETIEPVGTFEGPTNSAVFLEGFDYEWDFFNHRVSHIEFEALDDGARASVVGGTSTTGVPRELDPSCDAESCLEYPFTDYAHIDLRWARATTTNAGFARGETSFVVDAKGGSSVVSATVPAGYAGGRVFAVLSGFTVNTDQPLTGGPSCYDPSFGWHPTSFTLELGEVVRSGSKLEVAIDGGFTAGNSLDEERLCIDEVNEQAQLELSASVLFVVTMGDHALTTMKVSENYPYSGNVTNPEEQVWAEPKALPLEGESVVHGWTKLNYAFNPDNADGRGVYVRHFGFHVDEAGAHAPVTNYSPGTQLWDFHYTFEGQVLSVDVGGSVERGAIDTLIDVDLDDQGKPVVVELPY